MCIPITKAEHSPSGGKAKHRVNPHGCIYMCIRITKAEHCATEWR